MKSLHLSGIKSLSAYNLLKSLKFIFIGCQTQDLLERLVNSSNILSRR